MVHMTHVLSGIVSCLHVGIELTHYNLPLEWKKRINAPADTRVHVVNSTGMAAAWSSEE